MKESGNIKLKEKGKAIKESGTSKPNEKVLNLPFASIADVKITLKLSYDRQNQGHNFDWQGLQG